MTDPRTALEDAEVLRRHRRREHRFKQKQADKALAAACLKAKEATDGR